MGRNEEDSRTGQIKANQSGDQIPSLSGFITSALKSLESSKVSLRS